MPPLRAFVALPLCDEVRRALARAIREQPSLPPERLRWVPEENLHLTLRFLGDVEAETIAALLDALGARLEGMPAFSCGLASLAALPSARRARLVAAIVSESAALSEVARSVEDAAVAAGLDRETRGFRPHVTLARVRTPPLRNLVLETPPPEIAIRFDAVVVFRSRLGPEGARYDPLHELPLARG